MSPFLLVSHIDFFYHWFYFYLSFIICFLGTLTFSDKSHSCSILLGCRLQKHFQVCGPHFLCAVLCSFQWPLVKLLRTCYVSLCIEMSNLSAGDNCLCNLRGIFQFCIDKRKPIQLPCSQFFSYNQFEIECIQFLQCPYAHYRVFICNY